MTENNKAVGTAVTMDDFFTRPAANRGIQVPLYLPNGEKSEHWVRILGVDSDVFREADVRARRDAVRIAAIQDAGEKDREIERAKRELTAVLVVDWSFDRPCTPENVQEFFLQAPQIMEAVDKAASRRALFFDNASSS